MKLEEKRVILGSKEKNLYKQLVISKNLGLII